jgi:hypothetical protein
MPRVLDRIVPEIDEGEAMPAAPAVAGTASGGL